MSTATKTVKVSDLSGPALDWAVAKCEGFLCDFSYAGVKGLAPYSSDWSLAGPIIDREEIELHKWGIDGWEAHATNYTFLNTPDEKAEFAEQFGPTPLVAAMRCYVASKLGDTVEIPEELI